MQSANGMGDGHGGMAGAPGLSPHHQPPAGMHGPQTIRMHSDQEAGMMLPMHAPLPPAGGQAAPHGHASGAGMLPAGIGAGPVPAMAPGARMCSEEEGRSNPGDKDADIPPPPPKREGMKPQPRACGMPVARRTLADLKNDEKKTGLRIPADLPADFPRGPWVVDISKPPDHMPATGSHDGGELQSSGCSVPPSLITGALLARGVEERCEGETLPPCRRLLMGPGGPVLVCARLEVPGGADGCAVEMLVLRPEYTPGLPRP